MRYTERSGGLGLEQGEMLARRWLGAVTTIQKLSGGFSNSNFLVNGEWVLRVVAQGWESCQREAWLLEFARGQGLRVPRVVRTECFGDLALMQLEFLPGEPLDPGKCETQTFRWLGQELARVHSVAFEASGLFGPTGALEPFDPNLGPLLVQEYLGGSAGRRLGANRRAELERLVKVHWSLVQECATGPALVHSDFNPKNVLVDNDRVWLLDWEFAMACDPLIDLGNFFRFENDYLPSQRQAFLDGYARPLPDRWREAARLHDLISMLDMLNSPQELPETFVTALAVIDQTLHEFA